MSRVFLVGVGGRQDLNPPYNPKINWRWAMAPAPCGRLAFRKPTVRVLLARIQDAFANGATDVVLEMVEPMMSIG